ncbi:MAG: hypothetical protein LBS69_06985 [Prevotellaceae bacterium]|jgi:hypothetical protein|nr:hypothetical protein [Prevotellaceae bacterium]
METKIPFYNLLNMFLTGLIFIGCCVLLYHNKIITFVESNFFKSVKDINVGLETVITISFCAIIYEIGLIINRIGSLLENLLKECPILLPFDDDHKKFSEKKKQFPIMEILSREYALSRTSMTLFLITTVIACFQKHWIFSIVMFVLTLIFYFSMKKHAGKIVELMKD